jgi:hypothetical protein
MNGGAGTGTRTPGLLITSNPTLNGVLTGPIAGSTRIAWERKPQSYQLNLRASRVDVVHSGQLTSRRCHRRPGSGAHREVWFRLVPGSVAAQRRDGATVKPRRPQSAERSLIAATGPTAALRTTLNTPAARPLGRNRGWLRRALLGKPGPAQRTGPTRGRDRVRRGRVRRLAGPLVTYPVNFGDTTTTVAGGGGVGGTVTGSTTKPEAVI